MVSEVVVGQNLNLLNPPSTPEVLQLVSSRYNERDFALTPDGNEMYYTISTPKSTLQTIVFRRRVPSGKWTLPERASFCGNFSDLEPALSSDGKTMYFASNRPLAGSTNRDFNIWKVTRSSSGWGVPEPLSFNTAADEFYPSVTRSGKLYFTATYPGGPGREDIYYINLNNPNEKPIALDSAVNTATYEFNAFVDPDERFILFTSYGRKDDMGGGDLYLARKVNNAWLPAIHLKELNSGQLDYCPYVSPDGSILFYTSERHQLPVEAGPKLQLKSLLDLYDSNENGLGNIYWVKATFPAK